MSTLAEMYNFGAVRALQVFVKQAEFTVDLAKETGEKIGIDWAKAKFTPETLLKGMRVELEHGSRDPQTDVTHGDPETTAKIAWAHLKEDPEYYIKLDKMEKKADEEKGPYKPVDKETVYAWLRGLGTAPEDAQVHDFAEEKGYNTHQMETVIYDLAHKQIMGEKK